MALLLAVTLLAGCGSLGHRVTGTKPAVQQKPYNAPDPYTAQIYHILLGEMAGQSGQMEASAQTYLEAALLSDDPRVAQRAMQIALYARDEARAQQAAERWLTLQPDSLEPRQALSMLYLRAGRIDDSIAQFDYLIRSSANGSADQMFAQIAMLLSRESNKSAALKVMQGLVAKHEAEPSAQLSLGQLAAMTQEMDLAEHAVARALELKPGWSDALIMRAQIQAARGDVEAALAGLRKALELHPKNADLRLNYARLLLQAKRPNEARAQFQRLAREVPKDADVQYALGCSHSMPASPMMPRPISSACSSSASTWTRRVIIWVASPRTGASTRRRSTGTAK